MSKSKLTILLVALLVFCGMAYLEFAVPKTERIVHGPAIRVVEKDLDTLYQIRLKYKALHDTQIVIRQKYDTLYISLTGDTSCATTLRLLAMHRQLDSSGK
jgi:beta-lactamase superfamily II metal-dependent hydrolase